jgi:hypothetical protein
MIRVDDAFDARNTIAKSTFSPVDDGRGSPAHSPAQIGSSPEERRAQLGMTIHWALAPSENAICTSIFEEMRPSTLSIAIQEIRHAGVQLVLAPYQWIEAVSLVELREGQPGIWIPTCSGKATCMSQYDPAKTPHSGERSHGAKS